MKRFKQFLGLLFHNEVCKDKKDILSLLECMDKYFKFRPYTNHYASIEIPILEDNIYIYLDVISKLNTRILKNDFSINDVRPITEGSIKITTIGKWFADKDNNLLPDPENIWKRWLYEFKTLYIWNLKSKSTLNARSISFSLKIEPYITNMSSIITTIIEQQDTEI